MIGNQWYFSVITNSDIELNYKVKIDYSNDLICPNECSYPMGYCRSGNCDCNVNRIDVDCSLEVKKL